MPSYEYRCTKCKTKFELLRRIAARDDAAPCPKCKATQTARIEVQRIGVIRGVRPNAMAGEGEPEDFLDGDDDDFGGEHSHGGVDDWDDDNF